MKVIIGGIIVVVLVLGSSNTFAGSYQDEIDKFFSLYENGQKNEAVDSIYSTNPWVAAAKDQIQNVRNQLLSIDKLVGQYHGKVKVDEHNIKERFTHITYLALYDRQPVRFEFEFYRPKEQWIIYSFSFDVEFMNEVQTAARAKIAKGQ